MEAHQGFTNYATFGVAVTLDNNESNLNYVRAAVKQITESAATGSNVSEGIWTKAEATLFNVADWVKDYVESLCELSNDQLGMQSQMIQAGLAEVDWHNIADHYINED